MDTEEIRCFWRVYEARSINRAARQMFITPQGLSRVIHNLETELDAPLFDRTPRGLTPTACGTYLYAQCRSMLDKYDEILTGIQRIKAQDHKIIIGFSCGVLNVFPMHRLGELRSVCSGHQLQWDEYRNEDVRRQLLEGKCDVGFCIGPQDDPALWSRQLYTKSMDAIVYEGHPFYDKTSLSIGDLKGESFITLNERFYSYHGFVQRCRDFGFYPNILVKTMESKLIYRFCREKIGLGIDVDIHGEDINLGTLRRVELYDSIPWSVYLVILRDRMNEPLLQKISQLFTTA